MLETELKCMLDEKTYLNLEKLFDWDWVKEQVNSYYTDRENLLKQNGITLRVRTKDGKNKIQIKVHKNADSPLQICEEAEYDTAEIPEHFTAGEVEKMTGVHAEASLLGSLSTLRHSLIYGGNTEICLDKNEFLDRTDYEIELEYTGSVPEELLELLKAQGVEFSEPAVGKCTRFMRRLYDIIHGE